jgi:UDP-N-acetylmuramate--alanine ligase
MQYFMYNKKLHYHLVGIGGSGMSGIAEILLSYGFKVSGSDLKKNSSSERLSKLGAKIFLGHSEENLAEDANLLVYSSAVNSENPEVKEALKRNIPVIRRAEVLAELMRLSYGVAVAGSHGKTSTTSMIAAILEQAGLDPTVIIGGQVKALGSGAKFGKGDFLVAETDESDRSFLLLKPTMAVVTNIDTEHLTAYTSFAELQKSFHDFLMAVPFYGLSVLCIDDPKVRDLAAEYKGRKVTYGLSPEANLTAKNIRHERMVSHFEVYRGEEKLTEVSLPIPGLHMVVNSLAAIAIGLELDIRPELIAGALNSFSGVKRRLEVIGEVSGITVMNDYGHHPTEIRATLSAIRSSFGSEIGRLHVIFQPHRYSRTKDCFADFIDAFKDCDNLYMTDIYAASEEPIAGITGKILFDAISKKEKTFISTPEDSLELLLPRLEKGDMVLCLGAGSVGNMPEAFVASLEARKAA